MAEPYHIKTARLASRGLFKNGKADCPPFFSLERKASVGGGVIAAATPKTYVEWIALDSPYPTARPVVITFYAPEEHALQFAKSWPHLTMGDCGSPGTDLPGAVGTISAKRVQLGRGKPFLHIDLMQGGFKQGVSIAGRRIELVPKKLSYKYSQWRAHLLDYLFAQAKEGALKTRMIILKRQGAGKGGNENEKFFAQAAERHGAKVTVTNENLVARL